MLFLLNLIFAILAFVAIRYIMLECKASVTVATLVGVLMALVVFFANLAEQVV